MAVQGLSYNPGGPQDPVSQGHCAPAILSVYSLPRWPSSTIHWRQSQSRLIVNPDLNSGGPLFEMWVECPASAPDKDLTSVRALLPTDVPMVAVPSEFADFVGNQVPRIEHQFEIRHHGLVNDGAAGVWVSATWLMMVPRVMNVFSRMLWLGEGAGALPVFRSMLSADECSRLRSASCAQGLAITKRKDAMDTRNALEHFSQQVCGSAEFEAKQDASRIMFWLNDRLDDIVADADAETAEA